MGSESIAHAEVRPHGLLTQRPCNLFTVKSGIRHNKRAFLSCSSVNSSPTSPFTTLLYANQVPF